MKAVIPTRRSTFLRSAILLIALWQLGISVMPHAPSSNSSPGTRPHLHAPGDVMHFWHDETACPVCSANHASRTAAPTTTHLVVFLRSPQDVVRPETHQLRHQQRTLTVQSRAPPAIA
ncbi:MAG TPA: DUF2946 family protein [Longimicrobiales bacterium]